MSQKRLKKIRKQETRNEILDSGIAKHEPLLKFWEIIKKNWIFLLVVSLLVVLLYANAIKADFVSDDYASITQEARVGDLSYMFLEKAGFGNSQAFTTFLIYKIFGNSSPVPYHMVSILLYLIFVFIAFALVKLVTNNDLVAKLTTLLFVFHPIHVEAVTWISGRIYIILGIYICLSLINFIYYIDSGKYKYLIFSGLFFILGFLTDKPRPFAVFLLMFLYVFYLGWHRVRDRLATLIMPALIALVVLVVVAWPYINNRINVVNSGVNQSESILYNPFFQYPIAISKYLQMLWLPVDLTLYHTMYVTPSWLNWMLLIIYLLLVVYFYFKDKRYFFALSFIFLAAAPSMTPIKVSWLVAERYMFLGSLGFCWFLGLLFSDHWEKFKIVVLGMLFVVLSYFGIRVVTRNNDWGTNHDLWVNTCQVSPNSHNAWNNIGDDYDKLKDYESAVKGFSQSVIVKPNYADAYHNRANIFFKVGRLDLARESYDTALRFSPGLYQTYLSLTQIDLNEKKLDLALAHAAKAVEIQPGDPQAMFVYGLVTAELGKIEEAKSIFKKILSVYPDYQMARNAYQKLLEVGAGKS